MTPQIARLVRVQDTAAFAAPTWQINPSTQFLQTAAPLTWTGVRTYRMGGADVRVLRRWEQVGAPGHLSLLRGLPAAQGHPSGDRDVTRDNSDELMVGYTGDDIWSESVRGYMAPVARVTATRSETIQLMTRDVDPLTQTSLGYRVLWWSPRPEEVVSEGPDGFVGEWMGPNGPERYDLEHICDPDCEIVQRLARDNRDFDKDKLRPNHFAIAIPQGRGGPQSELLRVVDSVDFQIGNNPVSIQVPRTFAPAPVPSVVRDAMWTVGASRDLALVDVPDWDGDAAAASVFDQYGWPDKPDPARAREAFLVYDADAPELKGSYKLPIARYSSERGRLEVTAGALKAAAGYLSQTDIPADVRERARGVLDHYYAELEKMRAGADTKDACKARETKMSDQAIQTYESITFGVGRDNARALESRKIRVPAAAVLKVSDMDAGKVRESLESMQETIAQLLVMVAEGEEKMSEMEDASEDKAALEAKIAEHEKMLTAAKEELAKVTDARDSLLAEVEPYRATELANAISIAEKLGVAKDSLTGKTLAEVRRAAVFHKHGEVRFAKANDDMIAGVFIGLAETSAPASATETAGGGGEAAAETAKTRDTPDTGARTLSAVPPLAQPNPVRDAAPKTAASQINAGLDALG